MGCEPLLTHVGLRGRELLPESEHRHLLRTRPLERARSRGARALAHRRRQVLGPRGQPRRRHLPLAERKAELEQPAVPREAAEQRIAQQRRELRRADAAGRRVPRRRRRRWRRQRAPQRRYLLCLRLALLLQPQQGRVPEDVREREPPSREGTREHPVQPAMQYPAQGHRPLHSRLRTLRTRELELGPRYEGRRGSRRGHRAECTHERALARCGRRRRCCAPRGRHEGCGRVVRHGRVAHFFHSSVDSGRASRAR